MAERSKVLITDDEKFVQSMLARFLRDDYDVRSAYNGAECLKAAEDWQPDIILLDVVMPDINGYEVCHKLKENDQTKDIPVVFLSSKSSLRERMLGYEVGAEDYLIKSATPDELKAKLQKITSYTKEKDILLASADHAKKTAMDAMTASSELGKAVRFIECSITACSHSMLAELMMGFVRALDLSAVALFKVTEGHLFYSSNGGNVAPLEKEIIELLSTGERFKDFGNRTQVNFPNVSLLIKNMPVSDPEVYGRYKDTLPFVLGTADAKVRMIDGESAFMQQSSTLAESIAQVKNILSEIKSTVTSNINGVSSIISEFSGNMSVELISMGLDEDQEKYVLSKVEEISVKLHAFLLENDNIDRDMQHIVSTLEGLTQEQNRMIKKTFKRDEDFIDNIVTKDIELF